MMFENEPMLGAGPILDAKPSIRAGHALLVMAPMLAVMAASLSFWHFVAYAFVSNPVLNGVILSVLLWGAACMLGHIRMCFREERAFSEGYCHLLRHGCRSDNTLPDGLDGPVSGMLQRLETLGLGHHLHIHGAAMEPEFQALETAYEKRQELSNFLVGLMVGLGLLGTFVGLLETLMATSELIGKIAGSLAQGAEMESEFAKIVTGLQEPMKAMGTAFSASMFGLVGSIMLGFQAVAVRKTVATFVDRVRQQVLSLAQAGSANPATQSESDTERLSRSLLQVGDQIAQVGDQIGQAVHVLQSISTQMQQVSDKLDQRLLQHQQTQLREIMATALAQQRESIQRMELALGDLSESGPRP